MSRPPRHPSRALWALAAALTLLAPQPSVVRSDEAVAGAGGDAVPSLPITFGGPFQLVDHAGRPRTDADFRGRFMLIYFGYTYCPDVCPTTLATLAEARRQLADLPPGEIPEVVLATVDPARDTPAALARYVAHFDPSFTGVTGSPESIEAFTRDLGVVAMIGAPAADGSYTVDHSAAVFLIDPAAAFTALFSTPHDATAIARDYRRILTARAR